VGGVRHLSGQVIVAGQARGEALVTDVPLSLWGGLDPASGEIIDRRHPLSGTCLSGRVLVLPHGRGSCSASGVLIEAIRNATAPVAILTTRVDPIIGLGAILGDELYARPLPLLVITADDAATIRSGDRVAVERDGTVEVVGASIRSAYGP
jgi:predicted aconitase with swiveling domain